MKKYWQIKPWMFIVGLLIIVASLLFAFGNKNSITGSLYNTKSEIAYDFASPTSANYDDIMAQEESFKDETPASTVERMVIKTGTLSMVVDDVPKSIATITSYAEEKGGFLVTSDVQKSDLDVRGNLTVRVPSALLEETVSYIKKMGDVGSEHIDGRDITEEYIDIEAKLGNLQATEKQFLKIMDSAVKIEDILAVQRELSYVRENIESLEGRMKYLKESTDLSSLTIYLSTNPSTLPVIDEGDQWKPFAVFKEAIRSLLDTGKGVVNGLIWFGVYLPIIAIIILAIWGIRKRIRK